MSREATSLREAIQLKTIITNSRILQFKQIHVTFVLSYED